MFPPHTKILVVDDMTTMRQVMTKALKLLGFQNISEATCGKSAWTLIEEAIKENSPFELVLSDWNMPTMLGIDLLRTVRHTAATANLPFILVTAESEKEQILEALKIGASHYLIKPFTADVVEQRLLTVHRKLAA